jgi:hypothetical protein
MSAPQYTPQTPSTTTSQPQQIRRVATRRNSPAEQLLTRRDIQVLRWLAQQYAGRIDHVQALLGCGERQCQRVLARLRAHDLVTWRRVLVHEQPWVTPTPVGMRLSATGFRTWAPNVTLLGHCAAVNDVRLHIEERSADCVWTSERELAREHGSNGHLPDGAVLLDGRSIAVEVELTVKSEKRLRGILNNLASDYDAVLYYAAPAAPKRLAELAEMGRWPSLGIRDLPGTGGGEL